MPLTLEVITPERRVYQGTADFVELHTADGDIGVLPGHMPLLTRLLAGDLHLTNPGPNTALPPTHPDSGKPGPIHLAVDQGFARVMGDVISVLTEAAIDVRSIEANTAAEAQARAEKALVEARDKKLDPAEIERLESIARFAIVQQLIKKRNP
jgi:F-type H+-transporting ATPase subunit epsilon